MTVAVTYHLKTNDLASHSRFFPAKIRVPHHQLRNLISTVYENEIYFVHDFDICVLDLETNQRTLLATIPFEARCLAAAYGWVCVGGDTNGECAFVRIGISDANDNTVGLDMMVKMLGKQIVNSMTIHEQLSRRSSQADEVVVLISNNDKTVTLFSLSQGKTLTILEHPVAMNYASMSPDSTIIAAVGDSNEVFFYQRIPVNDVNDREMEGDKAEEFVVDKWECIATPKVPFGEGVWDDYSFAVTFSPNGKLCAVSAQGGYITVLDMDKLTTSPSMEQKSILCTFQSSRSSLWGCVRSLSFSPGPWDLLAWTEDHGRAGIADVRQAFSRRQCIVLDRNASNEVEVTDITPAEISNLDLHERLRYQSQRMHNFRRSLPDGMRSFDDEQDSVIEDLHLGENITSLDRREQSILNSLGTTVDDDTTQTLRPYSINYHPTPGMQPSATTSATTRIQEYDVELLNPGTQSASQIPGPQRRNSVILSDSNTSRHLLPADNLRTLMTASPAPLSDDDSTPPMSTNDLTPSANPALSQPMPYNIPPSDPWHVIEAALGQRRPTGAPQSVNTLAHVEFVIAAERRLANRLERQLADERRLDALLQSQLEARMTLLESQQQRPQTRTTAEPHHSPSLEELLQLQLTNERNIGRERMIELESEIRLHTQRLERLSGARSLVETVSRPGGFATRPALATLAADIHMLEPTLRHLEEDRRLRYQHVQGLETQLRRAESRIELASVHNSAERAEQRLRRNEQSLETRFLNSPRTDSMVSENAGQTNNSNRRETTNALSSLTSQSHASSSRARGTAVQRAAVGNENDRARLRNTELAGRVSESDRQLARIMLSRHSMDGNGNWTAANGYRRLFGTSDRSSMAQSLATRSGTENRSLEEAMRDEGLGTAGIGWSASGKYLYIGTEAGIFELKMNTKDRMCFPSTEFR